MDVAVSLIIVFALLSTASFFVVRKTQDAYPKLQMVRAGSDIVHLLYYKGFFNNPDSLTISNYLSTKLPENYGIYLEGDGPPQCQFTAGISPPDKKTITSGKEYFSTNSEYCVLRYKLWLK